jgi:hypothetical protein
MGGTSAEESVLRPVCNPPLFQNPAIRRYTALQYTGISRDSLNLRNSAIKRTFPNRKPFTSL